MALGMRAQEPTPPNPFLLGLSLGSAQYMGDLAPRRNLLSASRGSLAIQATVGYRLHPALSILIRGMAGSLSGDDARSIHEAQRQRNLHFRSMIWEVGLAVEMAPFGFLRLLDRVPVRPFINGGVAHIHFNPKAQYRGQWVALRPLGTEGQGLSEYPDKPMYSLHEVAVPVGAGIQAKILPQVDLRIEFNLRLTFTDYLDDVSGTYADPELLLQHRGPQAAALASRQDPARSSGLSPPVSGQPRGRPDRNDWYQTLSLGAILSLGRFPRIARSSIGCWVPR